MFVSRTRTRSLLIPALAAAIAVATMAACSSGAVGSSGPSGDPIIIGGSAPDTGQVYNTPERQVGLRSAVDGINAAGGIKGRPLRLEFCDGKFDPNAEISCARQLVSKKVVAVINPDFQADASGTAYKILDDAGIPQVGNTGQLPDRLTAPMSYPLSGGAPSWYYGVVAGLLNSGSKKVAILVGTTPSAQYSATIMTNALDRAGATGHRVVTFDPKADPTGATAAAQASADGVDGIAIAMATSGIPVVVSALRKGGYTGSIASPSAIMNPAVVSALGADGEGIQVVSQIALVTDDKNPGVTRYKADLSALDPKAQPMELGMFAWSGVQLFAGVASRLDTVDSASVSQALRTLTDPVDIGTIPPWSIQGRTPPLPQYPRLLNPAAAIGVVHGGAIVPDGKGLINPFTTSSTTTG